MSILNANWNTYQYLYVLHQNYTTGLLNRLYSNGSLWGMHLCAHNDLLYCKVFQGVICVEEELMSGTLPINSPLLVIMS